MQSLKTRREQLGLSQEAFGVAVGVEGMTVSRWERGESLPQRRLWSKIEEVTGKSVVEMLTEPAQ